MNDNKVAIVTGGAKNIGRATCIELAKLNFNILIHANTDKTGANETKKLVDDYKVDSRINFVIIYKRLCFFGTCLVRVSMN